MNESEHNKEIITMKNVVDGEQNYVNEASREVHKNNELNEKSPSQKTAPSDVNSLTNDVVNVNQSKIMTKNDTSKKKHIKKTIRKPASEQYKNTINERRQRHKLIADLVAQGSNKYSFFEAIEQLRKVQGKKMDETVVVHINTGIIAKKTNQNINSYFDCEYDLQLKRNVLVVTNKKNEIKEQAGTIVVVPPTELAELLKNKHFKFTKIITNKTCMPMVMRYARVLGPMGLLPSLKTGTINDDLAQTAMLVLTRRIFLKNDKSSIIHIPIGKISIASKQLFTNLKGVVKHIESLRAANISIHNFLKSFYVSTTMTPALCLKTTELCTKK